MSTLCEKIYNRVFIWFHKIYPCFYKTGKHSEEFKTPLACVSKIQEKTRVVFYLDNAKLIHFGDTLWFEPIIRLFQSNQLENKYYVKICCNEQIEFYFKQLGYEIIQKEEIVCDDIIVTSTAMAFLLNKITNSILFINFNYTNIKEPLINHVIKGITRFCSENRDKIQSADQRFSDILQVSKSHFHGLNRASEAKPQEIGFSKEEVLNFIKKTNESNPNTEILDFRNNYIVFNDYIDSQKFTMKISSIIKNREKLASDTIELVKANNERALEYPMSTTVPISAIIYTGTKKDKEKDIYNNIFDVIKLKNKEDFIMPIIDLRGKTNIRDAFTIAACSNVIFYVGFDTFWLHLFNLYNKECHVMLKPGFSKKYNMQVKKYVAVPFLVKPGIQAREVSHLPLKQNRNRVSFIN